MNGWTALVITVGSVALGMMVASYIVFLLVPITIEALTSATKLRSHSQLTAQIEQGLTQVDSPEYWAAIEALVDESISTDLESRI